MSRPTNQSLLTRWVTITTTPRFPLFSKLPVEIRLLIWELTIKPRVVELTTCIDCCQLNASYPEVPALSVCRESRSAVIKAYPLAFGTSSCGEGTRFNFEIDIVYCPREFKNFINTFLANLNDAERHQLRYLAIDMTMCEDWDVYIRPGTDFLELDPFQYALIVGIERIVSLENVFEVYLLDDWAVHIDWLVGGRVKLHEQLPPHLNDPDLKIDDDLPESTRFFTYATPNSQPVFGVPEGLVTAPGAPHRDIGPRSDQDCFSWVGDLL